MPATFNRVTSVTVDTTFDQTDTGLYPDAQFASGGSFAASVVPLTGPTATYGQLWRGMPIGVNPASGRLVPPSASGAVIVGVLLDDLSAFVLAKGTKVTFVKRGRVRSYAGGNLNAGDPVKVDTSANFSGFTKWTSGTDAVELRIGRAFPLDDGSATGTPSTAMVQGDTIFVDLNGF